MKRYFIGTALIFCLGVLGFADEPTFNVEKSRQELEIMKGILETSLAFSLSDEETVKSTYRVSNASNIDAFYLSGQGAVFMIPTSSFYRSGGIFVMPEFSEQMSTLNEKVRILTQNLALQSEQLASKAQEWNQAKSGIGSGKGAGVGSGIGSGEGSIAAPSPPSAPPPPTPPTPPPAPTVIQLPQSSEQKEEAAAREAEYQKNLEKAKFQLIETLANYGDSLTTVQSGEYINLILIPNSYAIGVYVRAAGHQSTREIITARKSWIADYKAGRLSLEGFKQKVLQYSN
ncbi:MAG: hypothetical protein P8Y80_01975 [Acidobacteriota bacterium]|jgi:TolA-binding protein